jgi:hypothetical protein
MVLNSELRKPFLQRWPLFNPRAAYFDEYQAIEAIGWMCKKPPDGRGITAV